MQNQPQPLLQSRPKRFTAIDFAMLSVVVIWAVNGPIVKQALSGWDPLAFNAIRFSGAAAMIFVYIMLTDPQWRLSKGDLLRVAALGFVGNGMYQSLYIEAIARSTASNTALIIAMSPLLVSVWGALAGTDRLSAWVGGGVAISVAGAGLVIFGQHGGFNLGGATLAGDLLSLSAMACWAAYTVYARGVIDRVGSSLRVTAWAMLFGGISNFVIGLPALFRQDFAAVTFASVSGMVYSAVFSLVLGYVIYAWAVARVGGARTAIYLNLNPLLTALIAWVWIGERWAGVQWLGALLVVAGVTLAKLEPRK